MFWRFAFQANAVSFETLLDKLDQAEEDSRNATDDQSNYSDNQTYAWDNELEAVLKDAEVIQELKKNNERLVGWLCKPEVIVKLFNWVFENGNVTDTTQETIINEQGTVEESEKEVQDEEKPNDFDQKTSVLDDEELSSGVGAFVDNPTKAHDEALASKRKLALISLEILQSDNININESILRYPENALQNLWDIVYLPKNTKIELHLSIAFQRIFTTLISRRTRQALIFLYEQKECVKSIINHLDDGNVLDILLKLLCLEELTDGQGVGEWLHNQNLIKLLVDCLHPSFGYDIHSNVSQVLLHILAISQAPPNNQNSGFGMDNNNNFNNVRCYSLVKELTSESTLNRIVHYMLDEPLPFELLEKDPYLPSSQLISSLTFGVTIFIEIIRRHFLDSDNEHNQVSPRGSRSASPSPSPSVIQSQLQTPLLVDLGVLISILTKRLPDFVKLLKEPRSINQPVSNTSGSFVPLGFERLKVCELIAELLHGSNMKLLNSTPAPIDNNEINRLLEKRNQFLNKTTTFVDPVSTVLASNTNLKDNTLLSNKFDQFGSIDEKVEDENEGKKEESNPIPEIEKLNIKEDNKEENNISIGEWAKLSILDNDVLVVFLDLFQEYPWNNFVHVVVFDIIHQVLNLPTDDSTNNSLIASLFIQVKLTERILKIQEINDNNNNNIRLGYMGYLTFIAEETVKLIDRAGYDLDDRVQKYTSCAKWQEYVYQSLRDTKQRDMEPLDGNMNHHYNQDNNNNNDQSNQINLNNVPNQMTSSLEHINQIITNSLQDNIGGNNNVNEQLENPTPDHFTNIEPNSFSNSRWAVDEEDEEEDDDDDEDDELGLHRPIPTHFSNPDI